MSDSRFVVYSQIPFAELAMPRASAWVIVWSVVKNVWRGFIHV